MAAPRVCLAISTFRADDSVIRLLEKAMGLERAPFEKVLVVDSMGSGKIPEAIAARGWAERVEYRSFPVNLGSAGNLWQRLKIPTEQGFDFVYALNHDGLVDAEIIRKLVAYAAGLPRVGAAYPLRRYTLRGGGFDLTGRTRFPIPAYIVKRPPAERTVRVHWGSSNGALYSTTPVREGARVLDELWLGWEDLAFGWSLEGHGFSQAIVTDAVLDDDYEYAEARIAGLRKVLSEKPTWYSYYVARNLILASRETAQGPAMKALVGMRTVLELGVTMLGRSSKRARVKLLLQGVADGLRGRSGKGPVP